jgi:CheY-specific phosphatase CheX
MSARAIVENPAGEAAFHSISSHLPQAVADLFASYDLSVCPAGAPRHLGLLEREVVATIGFTGDRFRGALMLRASEVSIGRWLEAMGMAGGDLSDTLNEFSNMLLGRVKSHMLREGLPIALAIPTATMGSGLRFSMPPAASVCLGFDGRGWSITVRLDASFEVNFSIDSAISQEAAEAGDCIMF